MDYAELKATDVKTLDGGWKLLSLPTIVLCSSGIRCVSSIGLQSPNGKKLWASLALLAPRPRPFMEGAN